jgi:mannose-6-phosphate isomerase
VDGYRAAEPIRLPLNSFPHFYRGGARIAAFRGLPAAAVAGPEDWIASTVTRFGEPRLGLTVLPDGRTLREAVATEPWVWLGPEHAARFGADPALLVKLLDVGQRLVVHAHPDRGFARQHLHSVHGKTEAWVVVETAGDSAAVYLGFHAEIPEPRLRGWVREQRTGQLLAALNEVRVRPGDAVLVPAGLPHAIGSGVLIVELQEPTDFSVLLEWRGFDVEPDAGHLGIGFDAALRCVDRSGWGADRLAALRGPPDAGGPRQRLLPAAADPYFRAERLRGGADVPAGFCVLVVTAGTGQLSAGGWTAAVARGDTVLLPWAAGRCHLSGDVTAVRCAPAQP